MAGKSKLGQELLKAVQDMEASGHTQVPIHGIRAFVEQFDLDEEADLAESKAAADRAHQLQLETWKTRATIQSSTNLEMFKSVIEAGGSALRAGMIINGGAAIALLTFLGNALSRSNPEHPLSLAGVNTAMLWFFIGTACASFGYMFRYVCQFAYHEEWRIAKAAHWLAFITGGAALGCFAYGGWQAYRAFA